jgi:hypothetical protein
MGGEREGERKREGQKSIYVRRKGVFLVPG